MGNAGGRTHSVATARSLATARVASFATATAPAIAEGITRWICTLGLWVLLSKIAERRALTIYPVDGKRGYLLHRGLVCSLLSHERYELLCIFGNVSSLLGDTEHELGRACHNAHRKGDYQQGLEV